MSRRRFDRQRVGRRGLKLDVEIERVRTHAALGIHHFEVDADRLPGQRQRRSPDDRAGGPVDRQTLGACRDRAYPPERQVVLIEVDCDDVVTEQASRHRDRWVGRHHLRQTILDICCLGDERHRPRGLPAATRR